MTPLIQRITQRTAPLEPVATGMQPVLNPIDEIDTVLFDIYGTLLISGSGDVGTAAATDSATSLTQALIASGYQGDCTKAGALGTGLLKAGIAQKHKYAHKNHIKFPEVEILDIWENVVETLDVLELLEPNPDPAKILHLAVEYECRVNPVWLMPGAAETLQQLSARGIGLGIVSNAQFYTPLILEALFGRSIDKMGFDPDLCVWSYKELRAKPDLHLFKTLKNKINLKRTLYVGNDMLNDIWTATETGCKTALFAGDRRSLRLREQDSRCKRLQPDAIVTDLRQISQLV